MMNKNGWEKDTDTPRWRRCIDDPRRGINSFPIAVVAIVAIRPIITPAIYIAVVVIPTPSVLVTAVVMSSHTFRAIFTEGRHHVYTADHCG
jgi:hypothetical protein